MNYLQRLFEALKLVHLVNNNFCEKLFSLLELPTTFEEMLTVTSVSLSIPDFNLLSYELDNFTLIVL